MRILCVTLPPISKLKIHEFYSIKQNRLLTLQGDIIKLNLHYIVENITVPCMSRWGEAEFTGAAAAYRYRWLPIRGRSLKNEGCFVITSFTNNKIHKHF